MNSPRTLLESLDSLCLKRMKGTFQRNSGHGQLAGASLSQKISVRTGTDWPSI